MHSMAGDSGVGSMDPTQVFMLTGQKPFTDGAISLAPWIEICSQIGFVSAFQASY